MCWAVPFISENISIVVLNRGILLYWCDWWGWYMYKWHELSYALSMWCGYGCGLKMDKCMVYWYISTPLNNCFLTAFAESIHLGMGMGMGIVVGVGVCFGVTINVLLTVVAVLIAPSLDLEISTNFNVIFYGM